MAHVARGAVAVVGQRFDDHRDTGGAVALIGDGFVFLAVVGAGGLFDDALDVVVGDVRRLRLGDHVLEFGVVGRIGSALLDRDGDLTTHLREYLRPRAVGLFLFALDGAPFIMS